ncbi:uncharacterized protein LOC115886374 [Sitophilus oryzae]|uniref:Uncharacterized protein LOC115886374 n=1 Tax=Sitophilus oryzae TaxID=7048 RepID=A0A6J2YDA5_SITOR|nr:uncharacterized protein LOC115886374 [Sitophilus oryzae]
MRGNLTNNGKIETLSFEEVQNNFTSNIPQKSSLISVSANVYYGYQPLTTTDNSNEPMQCEDLTKSSSEMEISQNECYFWNRKRARESSDPFLHNCKKRRQDEVPKQTCQERTPNKTGLEEDLLRETHGCSYYHWIASNI